MQQQKYSPHLSNEKEKVEEISGIMKVSIVTSRFDITRKQLDGFRQLLPTFSKEKNPFIVGGDDSDYDIFLSLLGQGFEVEVYPHSGSSNNIDRFNGAKIINTSLPLRERNKRMVDECSILIGLPQTFNEYEDSPAWKTIRYGIVSDKEVYIISPNGYCWALEEK
jgi:hypothetical protein